jgi:hypothetical protein
MGSFVYFAEAKDGRIKIGTSGNVERRIANLNGMVPGGCRLLCAIPGDAALEAHLHAVLAKHRVSGEWFEPALAVLEIVERYRTQGAKATPAGFAPTSARKKSSLSDLRDLARSEMRVLIRACAEPVIEGDATAVQVERAARRTGLSHRRASTYWYGEARVVPVEEYFHVARIALRHATDPDTAAKITVMVGGLIRDFAEAATRFAKLYGRDAADVLGALDRAMAQAGED